MYPPISWNKLCWKILLKFLLFYRRMMLRVLISKYNHFGVFGNKGPFFHSLETIGSSTLNLDRFWLFIQSIYSHVYPAVHWVHSFFLLGKLVILSPCQFGSISSNDHRVKKGRLSTLANLCFYYIGNTLAHISCNISTSEFVEFNHIFLINKLEKRNVAIECYCSTLRDCSWS